MNNLKKLIPTSVKSSFNRNYSTSRPLGRMGNVIATVFGVIFNVAHNSSIAHIQAIAIQTNTKGLKCVCNNFIIT